MMGRFSRLVVVLGIVGVVLLAVASVFLWRGWSVYREIMGRLEDEHTQLVRLQTRSPYPSEKNVRTVQQNAEFMENFYKSVVERLRHVQVNPLSIEPADFPALLEKEIRRLSRRALQAEVVLPDDFTFGFGRYVRGEIPDSEDVGRLTVQLQQVVRLCDILFQAGISGLERIERQVFEEGQRPAAETQVLGRGARRARRRQRETEETAGAYEPRPPAEIADLVEMESYRIQVRCGEPALWKLLQGLANAGFCVVATSVEVDNEKFAGLTAPISGEGIADTIRQVFSPAVTRASVTGDMQPLTREERVVAGREEIDVTVQVNAYRFKSEIGQEH